MTCLKKILSHFHQRTKTLEMTESNINVVISTIARGELKISEAKSLRTGRFLLRRNDMRKESFINN